MKLKNCILIVTSYLKYFECEIFIISNKCIILDKIRIISCVHSKYLCALKGLSIYLSVQQSCSVSVYICIHVNEFVQNHTAITPHVKKNPNVKSMGTLLIFIVFLSRSTEFSYPQVITSSKNALRCTINLLRKQWV